MNEREHQHEVHDIDAYGNAYCRCGAIACNGAEGEDSCGAWGQPEPDGSYTCERHRRPGHFGPEDEWDVSDEDD